jgi:cytochrome P450
MTHAGFMARLIRPPGPPGRGVIGSFPLAANDPLAVYTRWAREYGDIFHYRAFHRHVYFLNHPDFIEQVLLTDFRNFVKGEVLKANRRIFGNGLLSSEGDFWLRQRRLMQPAFHSERIASYAEIMSAYAGRMVGSWCGGEIRNVHQDMMRLALEIAGKALFNLDISGEADQVSGPMNTLMEIGTGGRMLLPHALRLIPTPDNLRYHRAVRRLDNVVFGLIRQARTAAGSGNDLLSRLLHAQDEDGSRMTDRQLRDEAMTLLLAGHETTAVALSWTWYLLAQNPGVEENLHAELRTVLNGRAPQAKDVPLLPYTQRVIKESMRLYPPAWALARTAIRDFQIGGYVVPAGSTVAMSQWVVHRDPRFYDDPERFDPDRWLDERSKALPKFAYFPFGGGSRICIGASFATMEAVLVLATIAQRFRLKLAPGQAVVPSPTITLRPKYGIKVILDPL